MTRIMTRMKKAWNRRKHAVMAWANAHDYDRRRSNRRSHTRTRKSRRQQRGKSNTRRYRK
jgi:hypothetical protein